MEIDEKFWDELPKVTVWKKLLVYFLRVVLIPILFILLISGIIDYWIYLLRTKNVEEDKEIKLQEGLANRHQVLNYLIEFYSHRYLYGY